MKNGSGKRGLVINMSNEKKKRIGSLDVFIILAVLVCAAGLFLKMYGGSEAVNTLGEAEMKSYVVELTIKNIRETSVKYFEKGEVFFLEKEKSRLRLGEVLVRQDNRTKTLYTDVDGTTVLAPNMSVDEQTSRSDVTLSLEVMGLRNANGEFLLGGTDYLGVNKEIKIASKYVEVVARVASITESDPK